MAQQQTLMWNDDLYLRVAPEEGNFLFSFSLKLIDKENTKQKFSFISRHDSKEFAI